MSSLLSLHSVSKSFGTQILFEDISLTFSQGERTGLLGPNGAGKTSLLKIIVEEDAPDTGTLTKRQGLRLGYASQVPSFPDLSLEEVLIQSVSGGDPLEIETQARILLSKAQFNDFTVKSSTLSGGWKKRLDIIRALMQKPDLLVLDEPTNHLDLEGIMWLEQFLLREQTSFLVVSHDRYFLEAITNKVIELNRCYPEGYFMSKGSMTRYLENKESFLQAQLQEERGLASQVRDETEWLRRSPKARTTKSQSRVQKAHEMMEQLQALKQRNKKTQVKIDFSASDRETRKLIVTRSLAKTMGNKPLFKGIDLTLTPGVCLGVTGQNGTGKTTLLKVLAGLIPPDQGTIKLAEDLKIVYFDQHRERVDPEISLRRALSPNSDTVNYRGHEIHVNGWAKRFLFAPDRLELPVKYLSGGERARILIAKLMLEPADVLFLDEPTNDLDIPTLEVIEESIKEFAGAVVLISHDRCLMDRVCTQILGLGIDQENAFFASYRQWEELCLRPAKKSIEGKTKEKKTSVQVDKKPSKKLSYKEQRELDGMEENIMSTEEAIDELSAKINDSGSPDSSLKFYQELGSKQEELDHLYARWEELLARDQ
jgi:ATP-binding cassette subfamily F protein uup